MGKKSNKSIMRKQIATFILILVNLTAISACGVKGDLYQTPEQHKQTEKSDKTQPTKN